MSWKDRLTGRAASEPTPEQCPPNCSKCRESSSIDPDYDPTQPQGATDR
nr:hypothetical protein OG499_39805 [Streptomyces anulatus]WSU79111.1 hypothetical protein OG499_39750 [Streptomyces anulatus]